MYLYTVFGLLYRMISRIFEDQRKMTLCMFVWCAIVMYGYSQSVQKNNSFLQWGPSDTMEIVGMKVNTWHKWWLLMCFTFLNTCINEFIANCLDPWIINVLQDSKNEIIPYSKVTCVAISQAYNLYCHLMSVVGISLLLSQIDVLCVRIMADMLTSTFAMTRFISDKRVVYGQYHKVSVGVYGDSPPPPPEDSEL